MKVKIIIQENPKKTKEDEIIGREVEPIFELTDFWVRDELIESFWVDHKDEHIIFSIHGDDYHTPYTEALLKKFKSLFE